MARKTLNERVWSKVAKGADDECWLWKGAINNQGYGVVWNGGKALAHRVVYLLHNGRLESEEVVRHTCDNPLCCNPSHLIVGTQADNMNDMVKRGRSLSRPGESNPCSKLTEDDVREIRTSSLLQRELAEKFGVSQQTISSIKRGLKWSHVEGM